MEIRNRIDPGCHLFHHPVSLEPLSSVWPISTEITWLWKMRVRYLKKKGYLEENIFQQNCQELRKLLFVDFSATENWESISFPSANNVLVFTMLIDSPQKCLFWLLKLQEAGWHGSISELAPSLCTSAAVLMADVNFLYSPSGLSLGLSVMFVYQSFYF